MNWMTCPKCGAHMVTYTGYSECPMCGYKYPAQTITITSGTDYVKVTRCKDCKHIVEHKGYGYLGESAYTCESNMDGWVLLDSYCSMAERKEE